MDTLGDAYPREQVRIRQCILNGQEIGPEGRFYVLMAEDLLKRADKAAIEGDVVAMIRLYKEMQEFKD